VCDTCDWEDVLEQIDDMMSEERYDFAADTLVGIREWVAEKEHITENQKSAISNIEDSVHR